MKKLNRAFTLVEILVVILIISVLAAILFPVIARAKLASMKTACMSNLGQCAKALALYCQDNDENEPVSAVPWGPKLIRVQSPLGTYAGGGQVFRSPFDLPAGRSGLPLHDRLFPQSYRATWLTWEGESGRLAWVQVKALDANPIVFRSYFYDDRVRGMLLADRSLSGAFENGIALVARRDTSVAILRKADMLDKNGTPYGDFDEKRSAWGLATEADCPLDICDGQKLPNGMRF